MQARASSALQCCEPKPSKYWVEVSASAPTLLNTLSQIKTRQLLRAELHAGLAVRESERRIDDLLVHDPKRFHVVLKAVAD